MTDIMLDIETLGTKPGCIVLSIGAVVFDRNTGETGEEFYCVIDPKSSADAGLTSDIDTVMWWMGQSNAARAVFSKEEKLPLGFAAVEFSDWAFDVQEHSLATIWAQGQDFDGPILAHALREVKVQAPWDFRMLRDTRTVYDVCGFDSKSVTRDGTYHNALDDALHQVKCLHAALKSRGLDQ